MVGYADGFEGGWESGGTDGGGDTMHFQGTLSLEKRVAVHKAAQNAA